MLQPRPSKPMPPALRRSLTVVCLACSASLLAAENPKDRPVDEAKKASAAQGAAAAAEHPQNCSVEEAKKALAASPGLRTALEATFNMNPARCGTLRLMITRLANASKPGGRKLEGDKPLDIRAAESERAAARANPQFAKALSEEVGGETDPSRRLLIEAALLHDEGHYKASELLLAKLRQGQVP